MKLLFVVGTPARLNALTPEHEPLGGTESAACYLARHLAARGHLVTLAAQLAPGTPSLLCGVHHIARETLAHDDAAAAFDAVVAVGAPSAAQFLRTRAPRACHIAWLHMMPDQPDMARLPAMTPFIDWAIFVSRTQQAAVAFGGRSHVIGNGIAPAFENMFATPADLAAAKQNRAAYTSTPFRGLGLLTDVMARADIATQLDVYSAMRIYQAPETGMEPLYARIAAAPRCHYHGAVSQPALAAALRPAAFLAYPSRFAETYCIAAVEAIAAGMKVVTTDLGALRETTLGFADLLPVDGLDEAEILAGYTALLERNAGEFLARPDAWAQTRFDQAALVNRQCSWTVRAREWEEFLSLALAQQGR